MLDMKNAYLAVNKDISALFKLSILARQSTTRDHYAIAMARVHPSEVLCEEKEEDTIGFLFPRLRSHDKPTINIIDS